VAALTPLTAFARTLLDDTTQAAMRATLALTPGTDVQAQDAELQAIAGLTSAADRLPYFTGLGTAALATFTAAGRNLVDDADATAQRATLGLGTVATQPYTEGTFTVTATGFSGTAPSGTAYYVVVGKQVTLMLPYLSGTSNATTFTLTGFPAAITPPIAIVVSPCLAQDNGVNGLGFVRYNAGVWDVGWGSGGLAFTASGAKAAYNPCLSYRLA
jgi:hypothetical protein